MPIVIAILVVLVVAAAIVGLLATRQPDTFRLQRSISISAPAQHIFDQLDDFHRWPAWSPWEHIDPQMTRTYSGAERGVGARYEWNGNRKAGQGSMEISRSEQHSQIELNLNFLKPLKAHNITEFTLTPAVSASSNADPAHGDITVNWSMSGSNSGMAKAMGVFLSMDKLVGKDFEKGLARLKSICES